MSPGKHKSFDFVPTENKEKRAVFMFLGTGKKQNQNWFKPLSSADIGSVQPTALLNNINEDFEQALVEVSEHQMGDDLQYVDVEIVAENADEVKEKELI